MATSGAAAVRLNCNLDTEEIGGMEVSVATVLANLDRHFGVTSASRCWGSWRRRTTPRRRPGPGAHSREIRYCGPNWPSGVGSTPAAASPSRR